MRHEMLGLLLVCLLAYLHVHDASWVACNVALTPVVPQHSAGEHKVPAGARKGEGVVRCRAELLCGGRDEGDAPRAMWACRQGDRDAATLLERLTSSPTPG